MRFRYFDAKGNEVSLSTAAALALKIELGEVTETTLLYDAACDEWAPAGEQAIYRHLLEHGAPDPGEAEAGSAPPDDPLEVPEPVAPADDSRGGGTAPPLEDFWGPALSASGSEEELEEMMDAFDVSVEAFSAAPVDPVEGEAEPASADEGMKASSPADRGRKAPTPEDEAAKGPSAADAPPAVEEGPSLDVPEADDARPPREAREEKRPAAAPERRPRRRRRDPALARLEAIAREATAKMEQEERRARTPTPSIADRIAEGARKGGEKTGEALRTGAVSSARALSEGGRATAATVGSGMRSLASRSRRAWRRGQAALRAGVVRSGRWGAALRRSWARGRGGVRRIAAAVANGSARTVHTLVVAPARILAASWRLLAPIRRRARRGAAAAVAAGVRALRSAATSPLVLGTAVFALAFFVFTLGDGPEAGEDLWRATVGIARSVAADADPSPAAANERVAEASGAAAPERRSPGDEGSDGPPADADDPDDLAAVAVADEDSADEVTEEASAELEGFEDVLALASERALQDMIATMDGLARRFDLPGAPPAEWLGGYYLSHAGEFPALRQYWSRYRAYIRSVKAEDAVLYRRSLEARLWELDVPRERIAGLTALGAERFGEGRARRDSLYDGMAAVAEAAVDLHDFLVSRQAQIEYDPVRPGRVSRAPVLEAYPTTPEVKEEMDRYLDRILERMARVQELKPVSTRDLQDALFDNLQAVAEVDTFRLGPRDVRPDSGGGPPGG